MKELQEKLAKIQQKLKTPKTQRNNFGKYNYRSMEDILEAVKPLLGDCILTVGDDLRMIGDRFYVKATASITLGNSTLSVDAWAREPESRKGMDAAQVTGATSSYARKYALNGLLCIDDNKDPDTTNKGDDDNPETKTKEFKPIKKITKEQADKISILATEKNITAEAFSKRLMQKFGVEKIEALLFEEARILIKALS